MSQHTPGPWYSFQCLPPSIAWSINQSEKSVVASVSGSALHRPDKESEANARLIAAAPELLAACREALYWMGQESRGEENCVNLLRVAIAKAEGTEL